MSSSLSNDNNNNASSSPDNNDTASSAALHLGTASNGNGSTPSLSSAAFKDQPNKDNNSTTATTSVFHFLDCFRNDDNDNFTKATIALCLSIASMSFLIMSVYPYSGFMVLWLIDGITLETVGPYAGLLSSSFEIGRSCMAYAWGKLADLYGRKFVLETSLLMSGIFTVLFGLSQNFIFCLCVRFLCGLSNCIMSTAKICASELAGNNIQQEKRSMGLVVGMWGWGFLWGPALGGLLADPVQQYPNSNLVQANHEWLQRFPFLLPNLVGFLICLVAMLAVHQWVPETLPQERCRSPKKIPRDVCKLIRKFKRKLVAWYHERGSEAERIQLVGKATESNKNLQEKEELQLCNDSDINTESNNNKKKRVTFALPDVRCMEPRDSELSQAEEDQILLASLRLGGGSLLDEDDFDKDDTSSNQSLSSFDSIRQYSKMYNDESAAMLCTQVKTIRPRRSCIRVRPSVARKMSRMAGRFSRFRRRSSIFPTSATMAKIWNRMETRTILILYWMFCFLQVAGDETFPLYCISQRAGLGLSAYSIGNILSISGLVFGICQYWVYASIVNRRGLYRSLKISSVCQPLLVLIPFSVFFPMQRDGVPGWTCTMYLVIILAASRILASVFYASCFIALNRTVPSSDRGTMNGLQVLGGSKSKALGPIFAGFLVAHFSSSKKGGFWIWTVIGGMGALFSLAITFMLKEEDDDDEQKENKIMAENGYSTVEPT